MWKKIHTIYSIIATLLSASMFFFSFATIIGPKGTELKIMYYEKLPYLFMLIMLLAAGVCSVFTYRNGFLQARVCILTALMLIGFQIWLGVDFLRFRTDMVFSISAIFPIVAAILNVLAARGALVEGMTLQTAERVLKSKKKRR
jgi:hypothetical protein